MIKIVKEEIDIDESLVSRLNVICDFCRKIENTNLTYIEPYRIIINKKERNRDDYEENEDK